MNLVLDSYVAAPGDDTGWSESNDGLFDWWLEQEQAISLFFSSVLENVNWNARPFNGDAVAEMRRLSSADLWRYAVPPQVAQMTPKMQQKLPCSSHEVGLLAVNHLGSLPDSG